MAVALYSPMGEKSRVAAASGGSAMVTLRGLRTGAIAQGDGQSGRADLLLAGGRGAAAVGSSLL